MKTIREESSNPRIKLLSCRACLATDVILFNIHENKLADAFTHITGTPQRSEAHSPLPTVVPRHLTGSKPPLRFARKEHATYFHVHVTDGLPQHLCCLCRSVLVKCAAFRARSLRAQQCLRTPLLHQLTTDYIRTIDRSIYKLIHLSQSKVETIDYRDDLDVDIKKEESDTDNIFLESNDLKIEYEIKEKIDETIDNETNDFSDDNEEQIFVATNPVRDVKTRKGRKKKIEEKRVKKKIKKRTSDNDYLPDFDFAKFESNYSVEIITLTKEQQLEEIAARKQSANYQYAAYKCELCGKGFMATDAYNNHKIRHSPSMGAHPCEICLVRFKRQSRRQEHQDLHRLKFLCRECSFVSRNRYQAKKHFEWHTGKIHVCKHCGASFTKSSTYLSHVRLQHPAMNVACDVCGETFVGRLGLLQHKSRAHQKVAAVKPEFQCNSCNAQFENAEALASHARAQAGCDPRNRPCLTCGETLASDELLAAHTKELHSADQYKCLQCDKAFLSAASYEVHHKRVHLNVRWRKTRDKRTTSAACREPPKRRDAMCEVCGKACESNAALVYHQRSHTGERPYKCSQCPKCFTMPQALINHQLVHSDARPYPCPVCPKAFKQKVALQLHSRVHTGERPYKCSLCDSSFKQGPHLRTHVKLMHNAPCDQRRTRRKL